MHKLSGGCHCNNVRVDVDLPRAPSTYSPRSCDCDYCRKHGARYISDARGHLTIRITDPRKLGKYRQGDGLAEFLLCTFCGVLLGVIHDSDGCLYGTVNTNVFNSQESFGAAQAVSPKSLSGPDKVKRWQDAWFADVRILGAEV